MSLSASLKALEPYKQFILWKKVPAQNGKVDKLPVNGRGEVASAQDPTIWLHYGEALSLSQVFGLEVGFVFTHHDPFFFIDVDNCVTPDSQWTPEACDLMTRFNGAAVEVSQSGRGLHIIGTGSVSEERKKKSAHFDLYTSGRFIALTDNGTVGDAATQHQPALEKLVVDFLAKSTSGKTEWSTEKHPDCTAPDSDEELITLIRNSKSAKDAFDPEGKNKFDALYNADHDYLVENYPHDQKEGEFDHSSADAAMCSILAFWTGGDCNRIDRIFRQSALYRDKWENRPDYRFNTVVGSVAQCKNFYTGGAKIHAVVNKVLAQTSGYEGRDYSNQFVNCDQQMQFFKGCTYLPILNRVLTPRGILLKPDSFKGEYGGHIFYIDPDGEKTTVNAFEAFTLNQGYKPPKADKLCFRPKLAPNTIVDEGGERLINSYYPIDTPKTKGDIGPFLDLVARMLPDATDQQILVSYMASMVQNIGTKFQYAVLLQGTEGNGKSMMIRMLDKCIGRRYSFMPNAKQLDKNFNSWMSEKLFIGVEEIKVSHSRLDMLEALKPMITNESIEVESKGVDQVMMDNYANFFMCSNYKDAIPITVDTRRYCILYSGQQCKNDKIRDGLTNQYLSQFFKWLEFDNGFAIVHDFLFNFKIPEIYDPSTGIEAPTTSSSTEAVAMSLGPIEQEIFAAIEEGRPGFKYGWISSIALKTLIDNMRGYTPPRNKWAEIVSRIGYVHHPALTKGIPNRPVITATDAGRRPSLYCNSDIVDRTNGMSQEDITSYYEQCQIS